LTRLLKKSKPLIDEAQAYRYALWLLNRRPHSSGELLEKFHRRTLPGEMAHKVLAKLEQKKFVDDAAFAEGFAQSRAKRSWGPGKIRVALQKKKISRELVGKSVASAFPEREEAQKALELLERQKQRFLRKKEKKKGQRPGWAFDYLVRKGYSFQAARLAVKEVFSYNSGLPEEET
jgi:regulatory protein